ncbi:MAG: UTP--glucose-1-phosphate uridylyltransferase [Oceanipulchritudo sp.]
MNAASREDRNPSPFIETLLGKDPDRFDRSIESLVEGRTLDQLLEDCVQLEQFWSSTGNLYLRVRALIFLYSLHRFSLPALIEAGHRPECGISEAGLAPRPIPLPAHRALQERNFTEAIGSLLENGTLARLNLTLSSGLALAYYSLALQNLADQVRKSVRQEKGNQWMFRIGHPDDFPLRFRPETLGREDGPSPWLIEQTPVRMDLSHSSWSDIFFLGMDRPEFARVINVSVDLAMSGNETGPVPPCLSALRVIDRPVIRLLSLDLEASAEVTDLATLFDFGRDYLGLLKAAVIASGLVPPGMEGSRTPLERLLKRLVGPGKGIELVSWVRDIPKGSRLAVSTNLLGSLITTCMRATGQIRALTGPLREEERRIVASRAILGEWLGGSGGGWQDSGGIWPGAKLIEGCRAEDVNSEARGALLPRHTRLDGKVIPTESIRALEDSLVLIHGGMAANVGPILEMVTERYLLRSSREWAARLESLQFTGSILDAVRAGDMRKLGQLTTGHFFGPLKAIIPWASNAFTERLIAEVSEALGKDFWGFWMLGGMSGGGMGLILNPGQRERAKPVLSEILLRLKQEFEQALPFAMDPVLYDFKINPAGTAGLVLRDAGAKGAPDPDSSKQAFLKAYFRHQLPVLLQKHPSERTALERQDLGRVHQLSHSHAKEFLASVVPEIADDREGDSNPVSPLEQLLKRHGFDSRQHEQIREDLLAGRVGLSQNRLHPKTHIEDVPREDLQFRFDRAACLEAGRKALAGGQCAVLTLAAGAGSRWTQGAGVVKALHPFAPLKGVFRSFLDIHVAKTRQSSRAAGVRIPHLVTTSYLTHEPIQGWMAAAGGKTLNHREEVDLRLSEGRSVGLRMVPTLRDLRYAWYDLPQEKLDEQAEKMRDSVRQALMRWALENGEASDYRDNVPMQCLHPVGHWYEVPNLLLNGTLQRLLSDYPNLKVLLLHNIDTLGASLDPAFLGHHLLSGAPISYEVIQRRFEDVGGGLARVDGLMRLVEGFALPREEDEFRLSFYNTLTSWIDVDALIRIFGLDRNDLLNPEWLPGGTRYARLQETVRAVAAKMPTYITLKESKKRWGRGQEDVFPVLQFERLWGDMSAYLPSQGKGHAAFLEVPRWRGQQLKDPAQLDSWSREGSLVRLESELEDFL